jgi:hypothetical protein
MNPEGIDPRQVPMIGAVCPRQSTFPETPFLDYNAHRLIGR